MAICAQIQKVSHKHEALLNHMLANPTQPLKEVAMAFGITQSWLSVIVHSSSFKARMQEAKGQVFEDAVMHPIQDKLLGAAHTATERLLELVPRETDVKVITDVMDKTLKNLGYGQQNNGTQIQQNNTLVVGGAVSADAIERARSLVGAARRTEELPLDQSGQLGGDDVSEVPAIGESGVGEGDPTATLLLEAPKPEPEVQEGAEVRVNGTGAPATPV